MIKPALSTIGLACDLIGAFLLSVPMVWNIDAFVTKLSDCLAWLRSVRGFLGSLYPILGLIAFAFQGVFVLYAFSSIPVKGGIVKVIGPGRSVFVDHATVRLFLIALGAVMTLVVLFVSTEFVVNRLLRFSEWIKEGEKERERRVGRIGLGILAVGFVAQAVINFF